MRLLFVCMGNICRSPTAEAVMRALVAREGLGDEVTIDSAGTGAWHVGNPPDERSAEAAARRGVTLAGSARQVVPEDFERFDLLLCADRSNARELGQIAPSPQAREKIVLLRSFDAAAARAGEHSVPDPYYGGRDGFEDVLDIVERACEGLLAQLRADGRL